MKTSLAERAILNRILTRKADVFLRRDFADVAGYAQVGRALRSLVKKGRLLRLGYGLYSRAAPSVFDGSPAPVKGIGSIAAEALTRLGVRVYPSSMQRAYDEGRTTQVPSGRVIGVDKRVRRKITIKGITIRLEHARRRRATKPPSV